MNVDVADNVLRTEAGMRAAMDAIHNLFVILRHHAGERVETGETFDAKLIFQLSDWVEVMPTYLWRIDAEALEDFRNALDAVASLDPMFCNVLARFDRALSNDQPIGAGSHELRRPE